jgi:hypothetical protein
VSDVAKEVILIQKKTGWYLEEIQQRSNRRYILKNMLRRKMYHDKKTFSSGKKYKVCVYVATVLRGNGGPKRDARMLGETCSVK